MEMILELHLRITQRLATVNEAITRMLGRKLRARAANYSSRLSK